MTSVAHAKPGAHGGGHHAPMSFWQKYIFSTDHKIIGIQFLFVSLFFLLVGGLLAMQIRWQLGFPGKPMPGGGILPESMVLGRRDPPEYYIQLVTMHGTFMVFLRDHAAARRGVRELPDPAEDRDARHGVPPH